ncbi:protein DnaK [Seminavis robusta]|uniref:Protein DnaK n=1 Tax=Seminavis robusta TaxID=568900 RepID=A0A9N8DEH6_9STRA|nr:protein DnaK [Seminavis robusta]|eukprot:Sro56_g032880.1 protein DnaK (433) ;mRNA; r:96513-97811
MNRMEEEWEDYQWQLQQYEKAHRNENSGATDQYKDGTLAVDVGTMFVKLAHNGNGILATREGARSTFAGIIQPPDGEEVLMGQRAFEKFWELDPKTTSMARSSAAEENTEEILMKVVSPSIQDAVERAGLDHSKMRSIVTVPPTAVQDTQDKNNPWNHTHNNDTWKTAEWIPEPVAAVWGAQVHGELPLHDLNKPVLVIDMGASMTSLSVVQRDVVLTNVSLDFGAQVYVDAICDHVVESQPGLSTVKNDGMAWQRLRTAAQEAVQELNTQPQAQLNIPYIGMDLETREPIHLDLRVPRQLIEQKVADAIVTDMILKYEDGSSSSILSPHVPVVPHSLSSLWMSLMTQLLTGINQQPQDLGHVLVVGGGAKHQMVESTIKECFGFFQTEVVLPALSTRSELVALGASSLLPQYEYHFDKGLVRLEGEATAEA